MSEKRMRFLRRRANYDPATPKNYKKMANGMVVNDVQEYVNYKALKSAFRFSGRTK